METYRKQGRAIRYENGELFRVEECGLAVEDGALFTCRPERGADILEAPSEVSTVDQMRSAVDSIRSAAASSDIERLIVTHGSSTHAFDGIQWAEAHRRVHLALRHGALRVLIDRADFSTSEIGAVSSALTRAGARRAAPAALRLAPAVTATILPLLARRNVDGLAGSQNSLGLDGKGQPIVAVAQPSEWPNWYRPSYRVRPVRAPMHLVGRGDSTAVDPRLPVAIALLAPATSLLLDVLIDDGDQVYPAWVTIGQIRAVGPAEEWYPYGAGSFGAEMML